VTASPPLVISDDEVGRLSSGMRNAIGRLRLDGTLADA
jgi:hypothetical protein